MNEAARILGVGRRRAQQLLGAGRHTVPFAEVWEVLCNRADGLNPCTGEITTWEHVVAIADLRALLERHGTQADVAWAIDEEVTQREVCEWMSGKRRPRPWAMAAIHRARGGNQME